MSEFKITLDGTEYTKDCANLEAFTIEYSLDEDSRTLTYKTTNELIFTGDAYDYILSKFFDVMNGNLAEIKARVTVNCCKSLTYDFLITSEGLNHCPDQCNVSANLIAADNSFLCFNKLRTRIIWRSLFAFINDTSYFMKVPYAQNVDIWRNILRYLWIIVRAIPLISFIVIVDEVFGDGNNFVKRTEDWLVGAGFYGIAFNIRNAIKKNAEDCGIEFVSSILNSNDYSSLYLFSQRYNKGLRVSNNSQGEYLVMLELNGENVTTLQLLEELEPLFNAEYRIFNGKLIFEQRSWFKQNTPELFNADRLFADGLADGICYQYIQGQLYASANLRYADDTLDTGGNESSVRNANSRYEWNDPVNKVQRGIYEPSINFSWAKHMYDDLDDVTINDLRRSGGAFGWGRSYDELVILENGLASNAKLLQVTNPVSATYKNEQVQSKLRRYHPNLTFKTTQGNLYDRFHIQEDPRRNEAERYQIDNVEVALTCEMLELLEENGLNVHIKTKFGNGLPESITLNFRDQKISVNNIKI